MPEPQLIHVGDTVTLTGDFTDADELPANPEALSWTVEKPDGTVISTDEPEELETGVYIARVLADQAGRWWHRVEFTGDHPHAQEGGFFVEHRRVPEEGS